MKPLILGETYFPTHDENRMTHEGDLVAARQRFLEERFPNLDALLEQRYQWMNDHINDGDVVVEFGCGAGFSPLYVKRGNLILTDVFPNAWVDKVADAMDPPFERESVDVIICSHMIHHMPTPARFFRKAHEILKPGGRIVIQDLNTALSLRVLLRAMRHEGWSYDIDVFDETAVANDPRDPWSANCAIPLLLFKSADEFEKRIAGYKVEKNSLNEFLLFPMSGGVISRTSVPKLPKFFLKFTALVDRLFVALFPGLCAMGRSVVLRRI